MTGNVLVLDDEATFRDRFVRALRRAGYEASAAGTTAAARVALDERDFAAAFLDLRLPDGSGLDLLAELVDRCPQTGVIMMTAFAGLDTAVEALRHGAVDYLEKPFSFDKAIHRLQRLMQHRAVLADNRLLARELRERAGYGEIIGDSKAMQAVFRLVEQVGPTQSTVLVTGASGTGKELIARQVHRLSANAEGRFVAVNCAALPGELIESELFGHERGAFTHAIQAKPGMFELANQGTLFLDEIAEMPLGLQSKLLRAIETREVTRVGGTRPIHLTTRLVIATNRDLAEEVDAGRFREDLLYRIRVLEIELPPLRRRRDDIPALVQHFVSRFRRDLKRSCRGASNQAIRALMAYDWPGNVRELQNVVERAMILGTHEWIEPDDLPAEFGAAAGGAAGDGLRDALRAYERQHIQTVLAAEGDDRGRAAERLRIGLSTLYRKLHELGIDSDGPPFSG